MRPLNIARLLIIPLLFIADLSAQAADGLVRSVSGDASLTMPDGRSEKITPGARIPVGSRISTGTDATVAIDWMKGAVSVVPPDTEMAVTSLVYSEIDEMPDREIVLSLSRGSIVSHLPHDDGKSNFLITTMRGNATAVGTDWKVLAADDRSVTISCVTGFVDVAGKKVRLRLTNGQKVRLTDDPHLEELTPDEILDIIATLSAAGINTNGAILDRSRDNGASTLRETPYTQSQLIQPTSN